MITTRGPTAPRKEIPMNDFLQPSPAADRESRPQPHEMNEYEVTSEGLRVGERLTGYHGLITGVPEPIDPRVGDGEAISRKPDLKE